MFFLFWWNCVVLHVQSCLTFGSTEEGCLLRSTFELLWMFYVKKLLFLSCKPFLLRRVQIHGFHVVGVSSDGNLIWNTCPVFEASPAANSDRGKKVGDAETDEYWLQRLTSLEAVFCLGISGKRECKTILAWLVYFKKSVSPLTFCKQNRTQVFAGKSLQRSGNSWIVKKVLELSLWTEQ